MCGILCFFPKKPVSRADLITSAHRQKHRGPDDFHCVYTKRCFFGFHRLHICGDTGRQPFIDYTHKIYCVVNGEIYNHEALKFKYKCETKTNSDCEIILELYKKLGCNFIRELDGMFAFVLYDAMKDTLLVARDHAGIIPLYIGIGPKGLAFASECKSLLPHCQSYQQFPPRSFFQGSPATFCYNAINCWYRPEWVPRKHNALHHTVLYKSIHDTFQEAVRKRLMSDVPFGCLLSGGLDSSLVAYMVRSCIPKCFPLHTFTIGLPNAPDFAYARNVATFLGTTHHEFTFTVQEGLDIIPEVIRHIETYDITTVRSSTPQYLLAKKIKTLGFKMVLSGEGSDEVWGGYLYFHKAPSEYAFRKETIDKLYALHEYDCLRTNKSMAAHGIEVRVPFLDKEFIDVAMNIPTKMKMPAFYTWKEKPIEKGILRSVFSRHHSLPECVLWRQKEQFSDSVGNEWIDGIKKYTNEYKKHLMDSSTRTPEEAWYKDIFLSYGYHSSTVPTGDTVACSSATAAKWVAEGTTMDPSGRCITLD